MDACNAGLVRHKHCRSPIRPRCSGRSANSSYWHCCNTSRKTLLSPVLASFPVPSYTDEAAAHEELLHVDHDHLVEPASHTSAMLPIQNQTNNDILCLKDSNVCRDCMVRFQWSIGRRSNEAQTQCVACHSCCMIWPKLAWHNLDGLPRVSVVSRRPRCSLLVAAVTRQLHLVAIAH